MSSTKYINGFLGSKIWDMSELHENAFQAVKQREKELKRGYWFRFSFIGLPPFSGPSRWYRNPHNTIFSFRPDTLKSWLFSQTSHESTCGYNLDSGKALHRRKYWMRVCGFEFSFTRVIHNANPQ